VLTFRLRTGAATSVVIEGVGQVQMQVNTVKNAWIVSTQLFVMLVFQSGLSPSSILSRVLLQLTPCSCVGTDSLQTITTPETHATNTTVEIDVGGCSLGRWSAFSCVLV
jgi:hypothetical protein